MEGDGAGGAGDGSGEDALDGGGGGVGERGGEGEIGGVVRGGEVAGNEGVFDDDGAGGGERDREPDAGVAVADGGEPVPTDGGEEGGTVDGGFATVFADAEGDGVLVRYAGVWLWRDEDGESGCAAGLDEGGDVEVAAEEGSAHGAGLVAVDPDVGGVVDAGEVQPGLAAFVGGWDGEGGAVPVAGFVEALGDGTHVFAVERLGVDLVVDQRGEHGSGNGRGVPAFGSERGCGYGGGVGGDFCGVLQLPAGEGFAGLLGGNQRGWQKEGDCESEGAEHQEEIVAE